MIKNILVSIATSIVILILGLSIYGSVNKNLGGRVETVLNTFSRGIQLSSSIQAGTPILFQKSGTCFLIADASIPATTTRNVDCAVTGYVPVSGDIIKLSLAATTSLASQYTIKSSQASSTNGFVTTQLINLTGATAVPSATTGFGSTTRYEIVRYQQ